MKQNYIFLDIDGVIFPCHNRKGYAKHSNHLKKQLEIKYQIKLDNVSSSSLLYAFYGWDTKALQYLKDVVQQKNAKIIISSSWKFTHSLETLQKLFTLHDLGEAIIDTIPNQYGIIKQESIQKYLDTNPEITSYVVLDDIPLGSYFPNHFVHCPDVYNKDAYEQTLRILK